MNFIYVFEKLKHKRDSHIVKFINRVKSDKTKRFILTSRTNILTKAISLSHQFQNNNIREDEFLLKIENLSDIDKANILYNHIYHSNIDNNYIDEIYKEKRYREIIKHRSFNPRIIEFITDDKKISKIKSEQYWSYILNKFKNPEDIWSDYFQNQIDHSVRVLSFLTVLNEGRIDERELRRSYSTFRKNFSIQTDHTDSSFNAVRKLAVKSLLNRYEAWNENFEYSLFNPSVGDFILSTYLEDVDLIISILKSLGTESSIGFLKSLQFNERISKEITKQIQFELFDYFYDKKLAEKEWDFLILLAYLDIYNLRTTKSIKKLIKELSISKQSSGERLHELLYILIEFEDIPEIQNFSFLSGFIEYKTLDSIEIEKMIELIKKFNIDDESLIEKFNIALASFMKETLNDNKSSVDIGQHIRFYSYMEQEDMEVDYDGINSELESILEEIISDFDSDLLNYSYIDQSDIIASIDIDQAIEDYTDSFGDNYEDEFTGRTSSYSDSENDIDAIFERS